MYNKGPRQKEELDTELDDLLGRELEKEAQEAAAARQRAQEEREEAEDAAEAKRRYDEAGGWLGQLLGWKVVKTAEVSESVCVFLRAIGDACDQVLEEIGTCM